MAVTRHEARGNAREPDGGYAGTSRNSWQKVGDPIAQMSHNVATITSSVFYMASTDIVRARIDGHIKEEATNVLAQMGLSVSDAIRMLLTRVAADKALPFDVNGAITQPDRKKR
jgi:DNA-damage-inducible protein J